MDIYREDYTEITDDVLKELKFDERYRTIFRMWQNGMKYRDIGKVYHVTRERIRQIVAKMVYRYKHRYPVKEQTELIPEIAYYGLSARAYNALYKHGVWSAEWAKRLTIPQLMRMRNVGWKTALEIHEAFNSGSTSDLF